MELQHSSARPHPHGHTGCGYPETAYPCWRCLARSRRQLLQSEARCRAWGGDRVWTRRSAPTQLTSLSLGCGINATRTALHAGLGLGHATRGSETCMDGGHKLHTDNVQASISVTLPQQAESL